MEPHQLCSASSGFPISDKRKGDNDNWLHLEGTELAVQTNNVWGDTLKPKKTYMTLLEWLDAHKATAIFAAVDTEGIGIPSYMARDVALGILKIAFQLQREKKKHGGLGSLESYGLVVVSSISESPEEPQVLVHLLPGTRILGKSRQDDRRDAFRLFGKIFGKAERDGESYVFPEFFKGWAILMKLWVEMDDSNEFVLQDHPIWWTPGRRLDHYGLLYMEENNRGGDEVKRVACSTLLRSKRLGPGWENKLQVGSALKDLYEDVKTRRDLEAPEDLRGKKKADQAQSSEHEDATVPLGLFARIAASHTHSHKEYGDMLIEFKYVWADQATILDPIKLDYELVRLYPNLLHDIVCKLHTEGIYLSQ